MQVNKIKHVGKIAALILLPAFLLITSLGLLVELAQAQLGSAYDPPDNKVVNGNFEGGFYPVPQLGFEPPDVGQVPLGWEWFRNETYGKYTIQNQEGFALVCPVDDPVGYPNFGALSLDMQSTDQPYAKLGVYQVVDVVPGQEYLFTISGTIQSMQGSQESSDFSHSVDLALDQTGNTNWQAVPDDVWTPLPWGEYALEFVLSGPDDPDIATVEDYTQRIRAQSNQLTIFLMAKRELPDWRYVRFTFDCIGLIPIDRAAELDLLPTTTTTAQPAAAEVASSTEATSNADTPAESSAIIPDSGGVPQTNRGRVILIVVVSVFVLLGLVGAGLWNIISRKRA